MPDGCPEAVILWLERLDKRLGRVDDKLDNLTTIVVTKDDCKECKGETLSQLNSKVDKQVFKAVVATILTSGAILAVVTAALAASSNLAKAFGG